MRKPTGFTLIELMIVVAIIAIIAAIAIPSLLRSRIAANETSAAAALKQVVSTEASWRQIDGDMNGLQDYWTLNLAGFYVLTDRSRNRVKYIDVNMAKSDSSVNQADMMALLVSGGGRVPTPKSGYYIQVIRGHDNDKDGTLTSYRINTGWPRSSATAVANSHGFGFCAYPESSGTTGLRTFIVSQDGVIYGADRGVGTPLVTWPGTDATKERATSSPTSPRWSVSQ